MGREAVLGSLGKLFLSAKNAIGLGYTTAKKLRCSTANTAEL